jgi:hypothetical protein
MLGDFLLLVAFVRRLPFSLAAIRVLPGFLAAAGWSLPMPGRVVWLVGQTALLLLAWTQAVRLAVRPLIERGTKVMIPPELAPEEIRRMLEEHD